MRKKITATLLCAVFLFSCVHPAGAVGSGNVDSSGGNMENAESTEDFWHQGDDGVRVSVIERKTRRTVGTVFDWTDIEPPKSSFSFVKKNKLQYLNGASLEPISKGYDKIHSDTEIPAIIIANGANNIAEVKRHFCDEGRLRAIAELAGIDGVDYDELISGKYTVLLEPIAYFTYKGVPRAMTATEAALYDRQESEKLRGKLANLTHMNQPLAMFLEEKEFGIPAGGGNGYQSNENIIKYLGVGTVNFTDEPEKPVPVSTFDHEYHTDTDVITSILVSSDTEINPDDPGKATFDIPGVGAYTKEYVVPEGKSQLVWIKWRTPSTPGAIEIPVSVSQGDADTASISVNIVEMEENIPPNPKGDDRRNGFTLKSAPEEEDVSKLTWGEWWPEWVADEDSDDEEDGEWVFQWREYQAKLEVTARTMPDSRVPTARQGAGTGWTMKSGYGVNAEVRVVMTSDGGDDNIAPVQHVSSVFPDFGFETYNRLLEPDGASPGYAETWRFQPNKYSMTENPVHFTPVWYPDGQSYPVTFAVMCAWTPAGELRCIVTSADITIQGSVYDDWYVQRGD